MCFLFRCTDTQDVHKYTRRRDSIVLRTAVNSASGASVTGRLRTTAANKKPRHSFEPGVSVYGLAVTYFRVRNAHYHRRKPVSRFCSGWEGVGPGCCGRQIEEE